jgi:uncharacterized protein YeaO (DUF488 family)
MKKIFVICTVRGATEEYKQQLEDYVAILESSGHSVHLPHRDTDQSASGYEICTENARAIAGSDEVHVFYNPDSQGTHFDMGVAFAYGRKIVIAQNVPYGEGKSYPRMLDEWSSIFHPREELVKQLEDMRETHRSMCESYGSELCSGEMESLEDELERRIKKLQKNEDN